MAAALPSFSDKTSAWSGDKYELWRGTEEEAAQITTATIPGFGGAGRSRGHCLASVSYFVLLLKVFLGCDDISQNRGGGKHFKCFRKVFLPVSFVQSFKSPTIFPGGEKEGRGNNSVKTEWEAGYKLISWPFEVVMQPKRKWPRIDDVVKRTLTTHRCCPPFTQIQQAGHKTTVGCRWCSGTCVWTPGLSPGWLKHSSTWFYTRVWCVCRHGRSCDARSCSQMGKNQKFQGPVWKSTFSLPSSKIWM